MSLALSALLNPAPTSTPASPERESRVNADTVIDAHFTSLQSPHESPLVTSELGNVSTMRNQLQENRLLLPETPTRDALVDATRIFSLGDQLDGAAEEGEMKTGPENNYSTPVKVESNIASMDSVLPESIARKGSHTSKSKSTEGLDTDKRYLCHICNKLFTRRRSVKDHINKIHPGHPFEAEKSIEVIVDPTTGIPVDPSIIPKLPLSASPPPLPLSNTAETKVEGSITGSRASSIDRFPAPPPVIGNKRPAPPSTTPQPVGTTKKGTANKVKPTPAHRNKKLKTGDVESTSDALLVRSPSGTPVSSRISKTPVSKAKIRSSVSVTSSPAPSDARASVDVADEDEEASTPNTNEDDNEVFCICRKGDNHTWMIACDGQCEDWFHGKCVGIEERDGDLIDKYICPNCTREGFQTTWKRMCRRKACRKPARVTNNPPKWAARYRSTKTAQRARGKDQTESTLPRNSERMDMDARPTSSRSNSNGAAHHFLAMPNSWMSDGEATKVEHETDESSDDEPLPSRGGALKAAEIRALAIKYDSIEKWREMGARPLHAPPDDLGSTALKFNSIEEQQVASIVAQMAHLQFQAATVAAREHFLDLVKKRSAIIIEQVRKENPKLKDVCGFDTRLSWSDESFSRWQQSPEGVAAVKSEELGPPEDPVVVSDEGDNDVKGDSGDDEQDEEEEQTDSAATTREGVCVKNRCQRHGKWQKVQMAELRFEADRVTRMIDRLEREEVGIRDRAIFRTWEDHKD